MDAADAAGSRRVCIPSYWCGIAKPLSNDADWGYIVILLKVSVVQLAVSFFLFARRDLHS